MREACDEDVDEIILDTSYGVHRTQQILQKMQTSKDVYGEDAMYASEVLLKTAGNKVEVKVPLTEEEKAKENKGK